MIYDNFEKLYVGPKCFLMFFFCLFAFQVEMDTITYCTAICACAKGMAWSKADTGREHTIFSIESNIPKNIWIVSK